jgi:hypothetical protein
VQLPRCQLMECGAGPWRDPTSRKTSSSGPGRTRANSSGHPTRINTTRDGIKLHLWTIYGLRLSTTGSRDSSNILMHGDDNASLWRIRFTAHMPQACRCSTHVNNILYLIVISVPPSQSHTVLRRRMMGLRQLRCCNNLEPAAVRGSKSSLVPK